LDDDLFHQAQRLREERAKPSKEAYARTFPMNTKGNALLSGNLFCADCGGKLYISAHASLRRKKGDSPPNRYNRYVCNNKARKKKACNGQTTYGVYKLDGMISELLTGYLQNMKGAVESELIEKNYQQEIASCTVKLKGARVELQKHTAGMKSLQDEVVGAIQGTSKFDAELLNDLIRQTKEKIDTATAEVNRYESDLENKQQYFTAIQENYKKLISWSEIFQDAETEARKMITAYLIESVKVSRGYELEVKFHVAFEQFFCVA